jgi:hypothetical protein
VPQPTAPPRAPNEHSSSCKIPVILVRCYSKFSLLDKLKKASNIKFRTDMCLKTQSIPAQNVTSLPKNPLTGYFFHLYYKLKSGNTDIWKLKKCHYIDTHLMSYVCRASKISDTMPDFNDILYTKALW